MPRSLMTGTMRWMENGSLQWSPTLSIRYTKHPVFKEGEKNSVNFFDGIVQKWTSPVFVLDIEHEAVSA